MKIVILAGGLGTRLREETEFRPKPMVPIGGKPILWHIMQNYAHHAFRDFVICAGYKGEIIKQYFRDFEMLNRDFTIKISNEVEIEHHGNFQEKDWTITVADTGADTMTGGRIKSVQKYIGNDTFMCTYGDGVSDINLSELLAFHKSHGKVATLTTVKPVSRYGVLDLSDDGTVMKFKEKPIAQGWINAGFFVFEPEIFDYLTPNSILENEPLGALASAGQLKAFQHDGFWQSMDTYRESQMLNSLWESGSAPWKKWA